MQVCLYLDDGWVFHVDYKALLRQSYHIRSDLYRAGVVWSVKKCFWEPQRSVEWLGMVWNAESVSLAISERRVSKLLDTASFLLQAESCTVRQLASFAGQVTSLAPVFGNASSLFIINGQKELMHDCA